MNEIVKERLKKIDQKIKVLLDSGDAEVAYSVVDNSLCETLTLLGYKKIIQKCEKIGNDMPK